MPLPPDHVAKLPITQRVDELSVSSQRDLFLADLQDASQDLVDVLVKYKIARGEDEIAHFRQHWFNENGWWKPHQPIQDIYRQGLIVAFQEAKDHSLPVDSYWVCTADQFEIVISRSERQITRLILTPQVEGMMSKDDPRLTQTIPVWIVRRGGVLIEQIKTLPYD
jgi:hypothetical protein